MRTIAVINQKGGVGKTTTVANLGAAVAAAGRGVLLVDLDPQAHLTLHLGVEPGPAASGMNSPASGASGAGPGANGAGPGANPGRAGMYEVLTADVPLSAVVVPISTSAVPASPGGFPVSTAGAAQTEGREDKRTGRQEDTKTGRHEDTGTEPSSTAASPLHSPVLQSSLSSVAPGNSGGAAAQHLWLAPSSIDLAAAEVELVGTVGREQILRDRLADLAGPYELTMIDCPPSLGLLTLNALAAADEVLIPLQPHFLALQGLGKLLETVSLVQRRINPRLRVTGVVLCMYESGTKLAGEVVADLRSFFESARNSNAPWSAAKIFSTVIRRNVKLAESPSYGKTIFDYEPKSHGAADYRALAEEFLAQYAGAPVAAAGDKHARTGGGESGRTGGQEEGKTGGEEDGKTEVGMEDQPAPMAPIAPNIPIPPIAATAERPPDGAPVSPAPPGA
ncbi:MAG: ParA family protein [Phycisphaerae bacterium]